MTAHVEQSENGRLVRFWKIVGKRLAGASVIKTATSLGVSKATVSKVRSAYTNHGRQHQQRETGKSALTERDRRALWRIVLKNHSTASQVTAQQNWLFILKTLFPQKLSYVSFTDPESNGKAATAKPLITENDGQIRKRRCHDNKIYWKGVIWTVESSFTLFPASGSCH
jgi:hypothetical protein